jgi:3-phenylpropionate/cinnamic acid dioxygenase small subunit
VEYDYRAIEQLLYRYAECIDDGNLEQLALLFTHGRISAAGMPDAAVGEAAVLAMYRAATRIYPDNGTPHTQHLVANPIIELDPDGTSAQCRSRFTVLQAVPGLTLQAIICGRYHDKLQKIDGQWWFSERHMTTELVGELNQHLLLADTKLQP